MHPGVPLLSPFTSLLFRLIPIGLFIIGICEPAAAAQTPQPPASGSGRVIVTVSLEGVRVPAVYVSLRSAEGNVVVGQTTTDNIG